MIENKVLSPPKKVTENYPCANGATAHFKRHFSTLVTLSLIRLQGYKVYQIKGNLICKQSAILKKMYNYFLITRIIFNFFLSKTRNIAILLGKNTSYWLYL